MRTEHQKIACNDEKSNVSTVQGIFFANLSNSFNLVKPVIVQEWGLEYQKWSYLNYHDGFEFGNLKNPYRCRFVKLGDFNTIAEKLALKAFSPILDDFQIFAKIPYFE